MHILVTGGAGFIGSHLVDTLMKQKHHVVVLDNLFRGKKEFISTWFKNPLFTFIEGDIRNKETVNQACTDIEVVYHLAAQSNVLGAVEDIRYSFETNVAGTFNVLQAAREKGVRRVVFTSSREAYGEAQYLPVDELHPLNSKNAYGASKLAGEAYCRIFQNSAEMEVAVVRLSNVYGLRDFNRVIPIFIDNVRQGKDVTIFGGKQLIDFIDVPTVVQTLIQASENKKILTGPVNVGSGKGVTLFELAERISELWGSHSKIIIEPARNAEVVQYTADIRRFKSVFNIKLNSDPLKYLEEMAGFPLHR